MIPHAESLRNPPSGKRINASAQVALTKAIRRMFADMTRQITTMLILRSGADGLISQSEEEVIRREARAIVERYFVHPSPFAADGVTPLATFPRLLNHYYVRVTGQNIRAHETWLKKNLPADLTGWLIRAALPDGMARESIAPSILRAALRSYDPMHRWVDPNGYRLSDRIWNVSDSTRKQIDGLIMEGIRTGESAVSIAKKLERFLNPEAALLRTKKPYGRDGSFAAVRLASSEISRASNHAATLAGKANPYVTAMDIVRSQRGDPKCPICPEHATIDISGSRVREPVPIDEVEPPPYHPFDRCHVQPKVTDNPDEVTNQLIAMRKNGEPAPLSPVAGDTIIRWMLGAYLFNQWLSQEADL